MNPYFEHKQMGEGITRIRDLTTVSMYLVEGSERAALIDTGTGMGDLRTYVETLTDRPLIVLNTHGHVDHAGGNSRFERVLIAEEDRPLLRENTSAQYRMAFAKFASGVLPERIEIRPEDFLETSDTLYESLADGQKIDLGGRTLQAVRVSGHTAGSTGFLDDKSGAFFAGDCCNPSTFLFLRESLAVEEYLDSLLRLKNIFDEIQTFYICHDFDDIPKSCIVDLIECCRIALDGKKADSPFSFPFGDMDNPHAAWAMPVDNRSRRCDGGWGNLVFDTRRLRKNG